MGSISIIDELKVTLKDAQVITPNSEAYVESLERWARNSEKKAVRSLDSQEF